MLKKGARCLGRSPCSRNARSQTPLVGRAQLGSSQPPLKSATAALLDSLIEHPETMLTLTPLCKIPTSIARKPSFPIACWPCPVAVDS
jgi:hypothetical protein